MNEQEQLNVCPRCGAYLQDGECHICGYKAPEQTEQVVRNESDMIYNAPDVYQTQVEQDVYQSAPAETEQNVYQSAPVETEQNVYQSAPVETEQNVYQSAPVEAEQNVYQSAPVEAEQNIYQAPPAESAPYNTGGRFSGIQPVSDGYNNAQNTYNTYYSDTYRNEGSVYGGNQYQSGNDNVYVNNQYQNANGNVYGNNPYQSGNDSVYGNNPNNPYQSANGNVYGNNPYQSANSNIYGNNPYQSANSNIYGNNPYQSGNNYYGGNNSGNAYGNDYGKNQYQGNTNKYGSNQYQPGSNPYQYGGYAGSDYGYNNPYSPYAVPQKKKNTGLIIGVIIGIFVLFLIALFALFYHAFDTLNERDKNNNRYGDYYDDYYDYFDDYDDYDDYYFFDYDPYDDYGYGYDYDFGGGYDDDYDYDADEYYTFHDDIKKDLSYEIKMEDYEYDTDNENVIIQVEYPVISGENVANLDKLNETIADEVSILTEYYEENFAESLGDDDYFYATSKGYVTYMAEDVLSIAFEETIVTSGYYGKVKLNCINIDMKDGVIMDNTGIIDVNDDFSVDFRKRSDTQNGAINELTMMTDQQITKYLKSEDSLIIFYTPQGLEVGLNYGDGDGWVTVTYKDYKEFLKIF